MGCRGGWPRRRLGGSDSEAERHASGFYEKMGGRYLRESEPGVWGRTSPIYGLVFTPRT
jgi:hypothetical protein